MPGFDEALASEAIAAMADETPAADLFLLIQPAAEIDLVYLIELYPYQPEA